MSETLYVEGPLVLKREPLQGAPKAEAQVAIEQSPGRSKLNVVARVRNSGIGPLCQLLGRTRSDQQWLDGRLMVFGTIAPGAETSRQLSLPVPHEAATGVYPVKVEFAEGNGYAPVPNEVAVSIRQTPRPVFALTYRILDDPALGARIVGNGDGVIQRGEAFDLEVAVKNTGDAETANGKLALDASQIGSARVFGAVEQELGAMPPGALRQCRFNVSVPAVTTMSQLPVTLAATETAVGATLSVPAVLPFDSAVPRRPMAVNATYYVAAAEAVLREGASESASEFGRAPKAAALRAVGELDDWIQIALDVKDGDSAGKRQMWVRKAELTLEAPTTPTAVAEVKVTRFQSQPPLIVFVQPAGDRLQTQDDRFEIVASVAASGGRLTEVRLLSDGREVAQGERGMSVAQSPQQTASGDGRIIRYTAGLKIGANIFSVTARDDSGKNASRQLTIVRQEKRGRTYAVCIGINAYPGDHALATARADAEAFRVFAVDKLGVQATDATVLVDGEATRERIMGCFDRLARTCKPEDSVMVLLAGHGIIESRGRSEERYFVPADAKWDNLFGTAIRMRDFSDMLNLESQRVLVIADACYSASFVKMRGDEDLFQRLAGEGRIVIGYTRPAQEDKALGHGYLTYFMLEGLKGAADADRNGKLTIREAYEYASERVRQKTGAGLWIQGEGDLELLTIGR